MVKKEFNIKKGQHTSTGKKGQSFYFSIFFFVISLILFSMESIPIWVSLLSFVCSLVTQGISSLMLYKTRNEVLFDESCIYDLGDDIDQFDINKLFGIGFLNHKRNSARFGWRSTRNGMIEIFAYLYKRGERISRKMIAIKPNERVEMQINFSKKLGNIEFIVLKKNGERAKQIFQFDHIGFSSLFIYKLFPYFGGNETAPHDMRIDIDEIS